MTVATSCAHWASTSEPRVPATTQQTGPLRTVLAHRAAVTRTADDQLRFWTVSQGTDAPLSVLDGDGRRLADVPLPGAGGAWGITALPCGGCVIGSYFAGGMFTWDGVANSATALGVPTPDTTYIWDVVGLEDGTVLGATYPDASVVSHHLDRGFTVLRSFGTDEIRYARALCVEPSSGTVWVGLGVTPCRVVGFPLDDPESATYELTGLPDHLVPSQLSCHSGRIWIRAGSQLWSFDPADPVAERVVGTADDIAGHLSTPHAGHAWVTGVDGELWRVDVHHRTATRTVDLGWGLLNGSEVRDGMLTGLFGQQRCVIGRIDVSDPARPQPLDTVPAEVKAVPSHMGHLIERPGSDTDLVLSAGQQGDIVAWHRSASPAEGEDRLGPSVTIGQVESWTWSVDGGLYAGTYPRARLVEITPAALAGQEQPRVLVDLHDSHHQSRPIAICVSEGAVHGGSTPGYGLRDGALTSVDLASGEVRVTMMVDETVHAIAHDGDALLVGTSPEAGTGAPVRGGRGRLLRVDPVTHDVLAERQAPGGARTVAAISRVDGQWWAMVDHGLWQLDPISLELVHVVDLGDGPSARAQILSHHRRLVIRVDGDVFAVDPSTTQVEQLSYGCGEIAVVGDQVWAIVQPEQGTTNTDLRRVDLE